MDCARAGGDLILADAVRDDGQQERSRIGDDVRVLIQSLGLRWQCRDEDGEGNRADAPIAKRQGKAS
jgi:hypothetical protein